MRQTEHGTKFMNDKFQSMLRRHGIQFYTSENYDIKAKAVERSCHALKTKRSKYFTLKSRRYVDVLQDLVDSYNTTYHRWIVMTPEDVKQITSNWCDRGSIL